ncbi:MAG: FAD-binding protein [Clostridiales Family XIII bacterium]|jgi:succinate dehydrogenase/fumarate reductase flavoprotein subunit|nr:FAD-binding protein [Clostridiales Family XIII bacterium]
MKSLEALGNVLTTDVLVVGGGMAGIPAAIAARESGAEVLIVDKAYTGLAGQSPRGGNGIVALKKGADLDKYCEYISTQVGRYLNDQKALRNYAEHVYPTIEKLDEWGVELTKHEDGSFGYFDLPVGPWWMMGINLYCADNMRKTAEKKGVRLQNHVNITDLLKENGRVVGAVGFDIISGDFCIFRAKTVILACGANNFRATRMFTNSGEGNSLAFNAGAQVRNAEFVFLEVAAAKTGETLHGAQMFVFNQDGENVWDKYVDWPAQDVCAEMILGMAREYREGRGPLYIDLSKLSEAMKVVAGDIHNPIVGGLRRQFPDKISWVTRLEEREKEVFGGLGDKPEAKFALHGNAGFVRVDQNFRTTVPGLYSVGLDTGNGSAIFGSAPQPAGRRGGPFMYCPTTGRIGGMSAAEESKGMDVVDATADQVEALREHAYASLGHSGKIGPREMFDRIQAAALPLEFFIIRSGKNLNKAIGALEDMRQEIRSDLTAKDYHELKLCHEAETMALCTEIVLKAALTHTESRDFHYREDYPKQDNKSWLKWVIAEKSGDGIGIATEDVPIGEYPYRPAEA